MISENTPAAWLSEVRKRMERLEKLMKRREPNVSPSTRQKLADDTRRSVIAEARELAAAAQILSEEIVCSRQV